MKVASYLTILFSILSYIHPQTVKGQIVEDRFGNAVKAKVYTEVEGFPYLLNDAWNSASVTLSDGTVFKSVPVKYDLIEEKLYYKGKSEETMEFVSPVKSFVFDATNKLYRNGYTAITEYPANSFFEVLADGKTQLLKKTFKKIAENKIYGSATITKSFIENVKYYLFINGAAVPIKGDKKAVLVALANKQTELEAYIKQNNLNLKKDDDFAKLITYYNTL